MKGLELGCKGESPVVLIVVQGLHSHAIAKEIEALSKTIPN